MSTRSLRHSSLSVHPLHRAIHFTALLTLLLPPYSDERSVAFFTLVRIIPVFRPVMASVVVIRVVVVTLTSVGPSGTAAVTADFDEEGDAESMRVEDGVGAFVTFLF